MTPKTKSRMWTITIALVLSLATAYPCAAGTVTNKSAAQRGRSPIYHFDVVAYNGKVAGKVNVNTANAQLPSYILVARGLTPKTKYTFGYTTASEELYTIGSTDSPKAGALVIKGTFPLDDVDDFQSARFWVMETPPTGTNTLINPIIRWNHAQFHLRQPWPPGKCCTQREC